MSQSEIPQIYLVVPDQVEIDTLTAVLDAHPVACVRMTSESSDETQIIARADSLRGICHDRDISMIITDHFRMVERLGLDGVHLTSGGNIRDVRKEIGDDAVIGMACGTSRHDGISAGEAGADYVTFGPVSPTNLGDGQSVELSVFEWWSEMIEVPVVAEGAMTSEAVQTFWSFTDFLAFGTEIWDASDPAATLGEFMAQPS
jgi:thiamine-phosphate pyrophosphorylase